MPTYEYRCPNGHDFEQFFSKISDSKSALPCPQCGAEGVRRISGGAGLLFKGSGFYITDYGKDGKKDQKPAAKGGDAPASTTPATSTDSGSSSGGESKKGESKPAAPAPAAASPKPSSGGTE